MPTVEQHIKQWKHNRAFAKTIDGSFPDWQINAIFYTALHCIDAALAQLKVSVSDHGERNEQVKTNGSFAQVRTQYLNLYRIARVTRYDAEPDNWIPQQYLNVADLVEDLLRPIENWLEPIIGRVGPLKLKD